MSPKQKNIFTRHVFACVAASTALGVGVALTGAPQAVAASRSAAGRWAQVASLAGKDSMAYDDLGASAAMSGTTLVAGAPQRGSGGRAYVFSGGAAGWHQVVELRPIDPVPLDGFGQTVVISGNVVVVGAPGHKQVGRAYVFVGSGGTWHQAQELVGSDSRAPDHFGTSVAVSGNTIVVGAPSHSGGRAYVFAKSAAGWAQTAELKGSNTVAGDDFGNSVAISGTNIVVGAWVADGDQGRAYVFTKAASAWAQVAELSGSGLGGTDHFGAAVAVSGSTALVGADDNSPGLAFVFSGGAAGWHQVARLAGSGTAGGAGFGNAVALLGGTALIGASNQNQQTGEAFVFTQTEGTWNEIDSFQSRDASEGNSFGSAVALSASAIAVGAEGYAAGSNNYSEGRVYVFAP